MVEQQDQFHEKWEVCQDFKLATELLEFAEENNEGQDKEILFEAFVWALTMIYFEVVPDGMIKMIDTNAGEFLDNWEKMHVRIRRMVLEPVYRSRR